MLAPMTRPVREKWLFEFAKGNLKSVEESKQQQLIEEVWEIGHRKRSRLLHHGGILVRESMGGLEHCTWKNVLDCHKRTQAAIEGLLEDDTSCRWRIVLSVSVKRVGYELGRQTQTVHGEMLQESKSAVDAFTLEMCNILAGLAGKIANCPAPKPIPFKLRRKPRETPPDICHTLFLRNRKDKIYCSNECRVRVAMQQKRQIDKER